MQKKIEEFLTSLEVEKGYSENTRVAYRNDLGQFLRYLKSRPERYVSGWDEVKKGHLVAYILHLKTEREYASTTVARKVAAITLLCLMHPRILSYSVCSFPYKYREKSGPGEVTPTANRIL